MIGKKFRMLTLEEIKKIDLGNLQLHELITYNSVPSQATYERIRDDIKSNGNRIEEPIILFEGCILNGAKRHAIAMELFIPLTNIPFAEFAGTEEEAKRYLAMQHVRAEDDPTAKVIRAVLHTIPELKKVGLRKHYLYEEKIKGYDELAAKINGVAACSIRDGIKLYGTEENHKYRELFEHMQYGNLTLQDACKILRPQSWIKPPDKMSKKASDSIMAWMNKILDTVNNPDIIKIIEPVKAAYEKVIKVPPAVKAIPIEEYDYTSGAILPINKRANEDDDDFEKRFESMKNDFNKVCAQYGYPEIHFVRGKNGIDLIFAALNEARRVDNRLVRTIVTEKQQVKPISPEQIKSYNVKQEEPDKEVEKEFQQCIGVKTKPKMLG